MNITDRIAIVGIIITITATIIVLYNYIMGNRCYGRIYWRGRRRGNIRNNRVSPEMFDVLARIIHERNMIALIEQRRQREIEYRREIELTEMRNKYKETIIIVNPDEKIQLGTI